MGVQHGCSNLIEGPSTNRGPYVLILQGRFRASEVTKIDGIIHRPLYCLLNISRGKRAIVYS